MSAAADHPLLRAAVTAWTLHGRPVVVKLGGSAMEEPAATRGTLRSVAALNALGVKVALVHGGGKPIDRAMAAAGLEPRKVAGRRYTDAATLEIVVRVLQELTLGLVEQLRAAGCDGDRFATDMPTTYPLGGQRLTLPGPDGVPLDLGFVGRVTAVDTEDLETAFGRGEVPVLASLAEELNRNQWLNVNADTAASAVAGALKAAACLFLTDTPGVLRSVADPGSLITHLTRAEANALIAAGTVGGGMVPKLEACFEALDAGAGAAVILDGRNPHALLDWFLGEPAGTEIVP